jgi:hypothetical protein
MIAQLAKMVVVSRVRLQIWGAEVVFAFLRRRCGLVSRTRHSNQTNNHKRKFGGKLVQSRGIPVMPVLWPDISGDGSDDAGSFRWEFRFAGSLAGLFRRFHH